MEPHSKNGTHCQKIVTRTKFSPPKMGRKFRKSKTGSQKFGASGRPFSFFPGLISWTWSEKGLFLSWGARGPCRELRRQQRVVLRRQLKQPNGWSRLAASNGAI